MIHETETNRVIPQLVVGVVEGHSLNSPENTNASRVLLNQKALYVTGGHSKTTQILSLDRPPV